jgi:hypothetical protein
LAGEDAAGSNEVVQEEVAEVSEALHKFMEVRMQIQ